MEHTDLEIDLLYNLKRSQNKLIEMYDVCKSMHLKLMLPELIELIEENQEVINKGLDTK